MYPRLLHRLAAAIRTAAQTLRRRLLAATRPATTPLITGTLADLVRTRRELIAEHALRRQQLVIPRRRVKRPRCTPADRVLLVRLAGRLRTRRPALLIVQPATVPRWHRELSRRCSRRKSRAAAPAHRPPRAPETIAFILEMAAANRLWGAERNRGELLKRRIRVAEWTIQQDMRRAGPPWRSGQTWAGDLVPVTDLLFGPLCAFCVIELASRRVVHGGVTRHPCEGRVAQRLREATPFGQHPKHLILDNDLKYGPPFACGARAAGIEQVRTAYRAPKADAICEWFLGGVRRECLDHPLVVGEAQLLRVLRKYVASSSSARPHQGLRQRIPDPPVDRALGSGSARATAVVGGLHHTYGRAAYRHADVLNSQHDARAGTGRPPGHPVSAVATSYLSTAHRDRSGDGCLIAALGRRPAAERAHQAHGHRRRALADRTADRADARDIPGGAA